MHVAGSGSYSEAPSPVHASLRRARHLSWLWPFGNVETAKISTAGLSFRFLMLFQIQSLAILCYSTAFH